MSLQYEAIMTCPNSGKLVSTGYVLTKPNFEDNEKPYGSFNCSACGQIHMWSHEKVTIALTHK